MNKKFSISLIAAASFAIGLFSGLALGLSHVPASPPPAWLFSEFKSITKPCVSLQNVVQSRPDLWRDINKELYSLKPQIDQYREQLRDIDDDFNNGFNSILSQAQRAKLGEAQNQRVLPKIAAAKPETKKQTDSAEKQPRLYQESSDGLVSSMIFVPFTQERFTQVLELDESQQAMLHDLLMTRRDRFLKLSEETPPPSSQLHRIADIIRHADALSKQESAK
jgi:uncharacterized phage infection (PIP) family protein YhgE